MPAGRRPCWSRWRRRRRPCTPTRRRSWAGSCRAKRRCARGRQHEGQGCCLAPYEHGMLSAVATDMLRACHACCRDASASACRLAWVPKLAAGGAWLCLLGADASAWRRGARQQRVCWSLAEGRRAVMCTPRTSSACSVTSKPEASDGLSHTGCCGAGGRRGRIGPCPCEAVCSAQDGRMMRHQIYVAIRYMLRCLHALVA